MKILKQLLTCLQESNIIFTFKYDKKSQEKKNNARPKILYQMQKADICLVSYTMKAVHNITASQLSHCQLFTIIKGEASFTQC